MDFFLDFLVGFLLFPDFKEIFAKAPVAVFLKKGSTVDKVFGAFEDDQLEIWIGD